MTGSHAGPDHELQALLESARGIPSLSQARRASALARARTAGTNAPVAGVVPRRRVPTALAAAILLLAVAAAADAALRIIPVAASARAPRHEPLPSPKILAASRPLPIPVAGPSGDEALPLRRLAARKGLYAGELRLLQRAHAAYLAKDFESALADLARHRRRYPRGQLAEEREALRVRVLSDAGRQREARRAEARFDERYPRSALLPHLGLGLE